MAQDTFDRKLTPILSVENEKTESRSTKLKRFILSAAAAGLIVAGGLGLWQQNLLVKPAKAQMLNEEIKCSGQNVVVRSPVRSDGLIACAGARDAIEFLASQDLDVTNDIAIELVVSLPEVASPSAAGCYLESQQHVLILVYSEFRKLETWFGIPIDHSLYRSLVSHEVAHLVADCNFKIPKPAIQAKEYLAYVTQFSTMEAVLREQVILQYAVEGFEGDWQMSTTIYMFDCMSFGVRAYLHFLRLPDGRDYLHRILAGEALIE